MDNNQQSMEAISSQGHLRATISSRGQISAFKGSYLQ
jgi:hypothetical protein